MRLIDAEAIQTLRSYPCVCEYGTSPFKCNDTQCPFGEAIRTVVNAVETDKRGD